MPANCPSTIVAILHPSRVNVSENSNLTYDIPFLKEFINTFATDVSQLSGQIFTLKEKFILSHRKNNFPIEYLEFHTGIKTSYNNFNSDKI